jgi:dsRNA-specific ribonuclease
MQFEVSYQRLEFLGDAVLDFIVTNTLYNSGRKPGFTPGQITLRRVQLVRNNTLARRCVQLGLHSWIRHLSSPLASGISATVRAVDESGERDADTSFPMLAEENGDDSPMAGTEEILEQDGAGNGDDSSEDVGDVAPQAERARGSLVGVSLCKACADVVESLIGVMYLEARQHAKSANGDRGDCMSEGQQAGPSAGADSRLAAAGHLRWRDAALAAVAETVLGRIMDRDDLAAALT